MANISINNFKSQLVGGGARANLFRVIGSFPQGVSPKPDFEKLSFLIKAATLPASTIAPIEVNFRGRKLQVQGDRSFEPWTITIVNDVSMDLRTAFEGWSNYINSYAGNVATSTRWDDLTSDWKVEQLDRTGNPTKTYDFEDCWPASVSSIDVGNDNENTIEEFTVELQYLQFRPNGPIPNIGESVGLSLPSAPSGT